MKEEIEAPASEAVLTPAQLSEALSSVGDVALLSDQDRLLLELGDQLQQLTQQSETDNRAIKSTLAQIETNTRPGNRKALQQAAVEPVRKTNPHSPKVKTPEPAKPVRRTGNYVAPAVKKTAAAESVVSVTNTPSAEVVKDQEELVNKSGENDRLPVNKSVELTAKPPETAVRPVKVVSNPGDSGKPGSIAEAQPEEQPYKDDSGRWRQDGKFISEDKAKEQGAGKTESDSSEALKNNGAKQKEQQGLNALGKALEFAKDNIDVDSQKADVADAAGNAIGGPLYGAAQELTEAAAYIDEKTGGHGAAKLESMGVKVSSREDPESEQLETLNKQIKDGQKDDEDRHRELISAVNKVADSNGGGLFDGSGSDEKDKKGKKKKGKKGKKPDLPDKPGLGKKILTGAGNLAKATPMGAALSGLGATGLMSSGSAIAGAGSKMMGVGVRAIPVLGQIAAVGMAAYDGYDGYSDTELHQKAFDLEKGQEATTGQKVASAAASIADLGGLTTWVANGLGADISKAGMAESIYSFFGGSPEPIAPAAAAALPAPAVVNTHIRQPGETPTVDVGEGKAKGGLFRDNNKKDLPESDSKADQALSVSVIPVKNNETVDSAGAIAVVVPAMQAAAMAAGPLPVPERVETYAKQIEQAKAEQSNAVVAAVQSTGKTAGNAPGRPPIRDNSSATLGVQIQALTKAIEQMKEPDNPDRIAFIPTGFNDPVLQLHQRGL
ncbi:MAG: hypothetical protein CMH98_13920 [Oceanospirillaceae bacterium]|nr:hypothetical protein [Oceanospirillaceae bacterium]